MLIFYYLPARCRFIRIDPDAEDADVIEFLKAHWAAPEKEIEEAVGKARRSLESSRTEFGAEKAAQEQTGISELRKELEVERAFRAKTETSLAAAQSQLSDLQKELAR